MSGETAESVLWVTRLVVVPRLCRGYTSVTGSVHARLIVLATAAILPMLLLFTAIAYMDYLAERERSGQRQLDVTHSMAANVERELHAATASLLVLALSPRLQHDDVQGFAELAARFISTEPKGSALTLLDARGNAVVNTRPAPGMPDTGPAFARRVFETGRPTTGNLSTDRSNGRLVVRTDVPVLHRGHVIYDLSLTLPASRFSDILADQHLPGGTVLAVFDGNGLNVARLPDPQHLVGSTATDSLLPALLAREDSVLNATTPEGLPMLVAFTHTHPSGWSVALAVPDRELRAPLMRSLRLALGLGAVGMLASAAFAYVMGQRILQPLRALTRLAADPTVASGQIGLRELDAVAIALRHSLRDRQAAMDALQSLNEQLELRIRQETASRVAVQAQLAQSQRLEALGQLAGGIAHDFNNVLQAVTGGLSLIQRRAADQDAVRRLSAMAADAAARGAAITRRLLTFARRGELATAPTPPAVLLGGLQDMLALTLGEGIAVRLDTPYGLPDLLADKAQLETVLINLAANARDAMPDGGTLTLAADTGGIPPCPANMPTGAYVRLSLTDTGHGMAPGVLARASEPFFTTKGPDKGTGLGLAMARGFAEQSGGGFSITSIPGQGTTVNLWFPEAHGQRHIGIPQPASPSLDIVPMRVLMVDDDGMVREGLAGELEAHGFLVTTAADGPGALSLLDGGQAVDLLITDHAMAGMTGLALIAEARRRRPDLPALLLTDIARSTAEDALSSAQDRLTVLLHKPIAGEDLARHAARLRRRK